MREERGGGRKSGEMDGCGRKYVDWGGEIGQARGEMGGWGGGREGDGYVTGNRS